MVNIIELLKQFICANSTNSANTQNSSKRIIPIKPIKPIKSNKPDELDEPNEPNKPNETNTHINLDTILTNDFDSYKKKQIFINTIYRKKFVLDVENNELIWNVKLRLADLIDEREYDPIYQYRLIFNGKELNDYSTIEDCHIYPNAKIDFILKLRVPN